MMDENVNIKGLDQLLATLEILPRKVADKDVSVALRAGGKVVQNAFAASAPEDTGFLAEHFNVKVKLRREELGGSAYVGPDARADYPERDGGYRLKVLKNKLRKVGRISVLSVCRFLEFGTSKMGKKPFMTQAFEGSKDGALDAMTTSLQVGIIASAVEHGVK